MPADIEALKERASESRTDTTTANVDTDEDDDPRVDEAVDVNMRPESVLYFDEIIAVIHYGSENAEQNIRGNATNRENNTSLGITVANPSVGAGNCYKSTKESQGADYKVYGPETSEKDWVDPDEQDQLIGVQYGGRSFRADLVDDIGADYATVYVSGAKAQYLANRLDCAGGFDVSSYSDPVGVMEYPPDDSSFEPAIRAPVVLRPDMEGESGAILMEQGDDGTFLVSIFRFDDDGDFEPLEPIGSEDHPAYRDKADAVYIGELAFDHDEDGDTDSSPDADTSVEDELDTSAFDGLTADTTSYEDLSAAWQGFVDTAVDASLDTSEVADTARAFAAENDLSTDDISFDTLAEIVEARS